MADFLATLTGLLGVFVGAFITPRVISGQAHRGWIRDKRAATYEKYAEVLQQVTYVVNYDDELNFRLGNEAQDQLLEATDGLSQVTAEFAVYASDEMKGRAESNSRAFWQWSVGAEIRELRPEEVSTLPQNERERFEASPWRVIAHPLGDDYPWPRIEAAGKMVLDEMENLLETIRLELRVASLPWYRTMLGRLTGRV